MRGEFSFKSVTLLLAGSILLFNIVAVFGTDLLIEDDWRSWLQGQTGFVPMQLHYFSLKFGTSLYGLFEILVHDEKLARLTLILLMMIPISLYIFVYTHKYLQLPTYLAATISLLPNILPGQLQIPVFVNGSYSVVSMLFACISIHMFLICRQKSELINALLFVAGVLFFFNACLVNEVIATLSPALVFIIYRERKQIKLSNLSIVSITLMSAAKALSSIIFPNRSHVSITTFDIPYMLGRAFGSLRHMSPSPFYFHPKAIWFPAFQMLVLAAVFYFLLRLSKNKEKKSSVFQRDAWILSILWFFGGVSVFWLVSPVSVPRHYYIPGFGMCALICLGTYSIGSRYLSRNYLNVLLLSILLMTGTLRSLRTYLFLRPQNACHQTLVTGLKSISFPPDSQVVIEGDCKIRTGGVRYWGDSYFQRTFKRRDIHGILLQDGFMSDPFSGPYYFEKEKPLFIYRVIAGKLEQKDYLDIKRNNGKNQNALRLNLKTGSIEPF